MMEFATSLEEMYPQELIANPEFDPEEDLPPLYDRYVLLPTDNEDLAVHFLTALHTAHLEQWARRDRERRLSGETRFADEDPKPEVPLIIKRSGKPNAPRFAVLPNGRRVLLLDARRVYSLCGIATVMPLEEAKAQNRRRTGYGRCPGCQGKHLAPVSPGAPESQPEQALQAETDTCPKCGAAKASSYVPDGPEHARCLLCGRYEYAAAPDPLSDEEVEHNEDALASMLFAQGDLDGTFSSHEEDLGEEISDLELDASSAEGENGDGGIRELDLHDEDLADFLANPAQDLAELGDRMHKPAFELFVSHHPLRKKLIDAALRGADHAESRMALWAAAGRILQAGIRPLSAEEADAVLQWLLTLSDEDLSTFAGDPEAQHPLLQHPSPDAFQPTDALLGPLLKHFKEQLRRFRSKEAGCRLLSKDYGLSEEALRAVAMQVGMLPGASPNPVGSPPHTHAA